MTYIDGVFASQLTCPLAPVACYDLIAALWSGTDDSRHQHAIFGNTLRGFLHPLIVHYMERMIFEWVQVRQRNLLDVFAVGNRSRSAEQIVKPGHLDFRRTPFHDATSVVKA